LLITVDTLRADQLGTYGARPTRTPILDRLGAEGAVFERAAAPMPLTRPSHFSILTSRYPREHGVLNNRMVLPASTVTIAELLQERGYETGAFVGVRLLTPDSGAGRGFAVFDYPRTSDGRRAQDVVPVALQWLRNRPEDTRVFMWVHLFDPHQPYDPPHPFRDGVDAELGARLPAVGWEELLEVAAANDGDVPGPILEHARALYRGEVEYTDHWIGRLLEGWRGVRSLDGAIVVLTADHGECFEHGVFFEHADCLLEGASRVPLIVRHPPEVRAGTRVASQVSLVDVAPTILHAAGIDAPAGFSGRALQGDAGREPDRYVLLQHPFYQSRAARGRSRKVEVMRSVAGTPTRAIVADAEIVGIVGPEWKYLRAGEGGDRVEELYRMHPEAEEGADVSGTERAALETMRARLDEALERHPLSMVAPTRVNAELLETLRALGYAD
jgi:arylsulfatase A-like enzyme